MIDVSKLTSELIEKYSVSVPRYTSYPTAPEWKVGFKQSDWDLANKIGNEKTSPISLYFHLPFCEEQCYFCACNIVISKKREMTDPYLEYLKKEIIKTASKISKARQVEQIHFGGGTPTYFSPEQLNDLFNTIEDSFNISESCETGIEVDPRVTTYEHMEMLSRLGFNRISMGVQDFDDKVQESINRIQPFYDTKEIFDYARMLGFMSVNVDLIYGLPHQSQESFSETLNLILNLDPDRIALFHYAHLPQMVPHQGKYISDSDLPTSDEKIKIFKYAVDFLVNNGYSYIGLDHFAKPGDELCIAKSNKTLHRNFQGYTTKLGCDLYSFGITAISNIQNTYCQNLKKINPYYEAIENNQPTVFRGYVLNADDEIRKDVIMKILCHGELNKNEIESFYGIDFDKYFANELEMLKSFVNEGFVVLSKNLISVTDLGQFFLRNIVSIFDVFYQKNEGKKLFSKSV